MSYAPNPTLQNSTRPPDPNMYTLADMCEMSYYRIGESGLDLCRHAIIKS